MQFVEGSILQASNTPFTRNRGRRRVRERTPTSVWLVPESVSPPRRPSQRKSTVCGLNRFPPRLINSRGPCTFKSSTRLASSRLLRFPGLSPRRSANRSAFGSKICNSIFSRSKAANSKKTRHLVSLFLGPGAPGHLRFGSAGFRRTPWADPGLSETGGRTLKAFRIPDCLSPRLR
jgi:hypothetical protein